MRAVTEAEIRASFVNASKRDAKRAELPALADVNWENLDYFGWVDAKREQRAYVTVVVDDDGEREAWKAMRIAALQERSRHLVDLVMETA